MNTTLTTLPPDSPHSIISRDVAAANELARIVKDQGLSVKIQGREYMKAEAWSMVDRVLGLSVTIADPAPFVDEYNQSGYLCRADVHNQAGTLLASATAICTRSERRWANADSFALFSMAQTRAASKAHRIGLSAIAVLAGFEPITEDEIDEPKHVDLASLDSAPGAAMPRMRISAASLKEVRDASRGLTKAEAVAAVATIRDGVLRPDELYEDEARDAIAALLEAHLAARMDAAADDEEGDGTA